MKQRVVAFCLFVLLGIVLATFVLTPFTGDIYVFMGSAHQMNFFEGNFVDRAIHTWDVKGIFARTFMCILFRAATLFSDFASLGFENYVRLIYLAFSASVILLSAWLMGSAVRQRTALFLSFSFGLLATHYASHLQHEMTAVLIMLLSLSLLSSAERDSCQEWAKDFLAGVLLGCLPYLKSIFIILPPVVLAAAFLLRPKIQPVRNRAIANRLAALVLGILSTGILGLWTIFHLYPEEISDMIAVSAFQNTLFSGGFHGIANSLCSFSATFVLQCLPMNPIVAVGTIALLANAFDNFRGKNHVALFARSTLWALPTVFILLSNCFFAYHYYLLVFPAIVECLVFAASHTCASKTLKASIGGILCIAIAPYLLNMSLFSANFKNYILANDLQHKHHLELHNQFPDISKETILYLDGGMGSYLAGGRSYLKYIYPLPLQRIREDSKYRDLSCRLECNDMAMRYNGKYVILDEQWFCANDRNQRLVDKVKNEYTLVGIVHYMAREWKIFGTPEYTDRISGLYARKAPFDP